jgi:hypothetical protein
MDKLKMCMCKVFLFSFYIWENLHGVKLSHFFVCIYRFTSYSRIFHLYGDVTIACEGLPMLGAHGLWVGRDLYHVTLAVTRDLGFSGHIRTTVPFSRLLRHARGCWGPILTWIPKGLNRNIARPFPWNNLGRNTSPLRLLGDSYPGEFVHRRKQKHIIYHHENKESMSRENLNRYCGPLPRKNKCQKYQTFREV